MSKPRFEDKFILFLGLQVKEIKCRKSKPTQ